MAIEKIEYKGEYLALGTIAKREGLIDITLARHYRATGDIYKAVKICKKKSRGSVQKIPYKDGEKLAISVIAKMEEVSLRDLQQEYDKSKDIFEAVAICKQKKQEREERKRQINQNEKDEYHGERLRLREIAQTEKLDANQLRLCFRETQDVYKAVFMAKLENQKDKCVEIDGKSISLYDMSLLLGVKFRDLINFLNAGMSINEIKEKHVTQECEGNIKLQNAKSLLQLCIRFKLDFALMYRDVNTYGKSWNEAVTEHSSGNQSIPINWICEKFDSTLSRLGLTGIASTIIIKDLQNNKISLEEALENYVIRKNARSKGVSIEWADSLYTLARGRKLIGEEFKGEIKLDENEMDFIKECELELSELKKLMQGNPIGISKKDDEEQDL